MGPPQHSILQGSKEIWGEARGRAGSIEGGVSSWNCKEEVEIREGDVSVPGKGNRNF